MIRTFLILQIILTSILSIGQNQTITSAVYFDTDQSVLRQDALQCLKALTDNMNLINVDSIYIAGNTDNRASNEYNRFLSEKRTAKVSAYLKDQGFGIYPIRTNHFGEEKPMAANTNSVGMQRNRRTDIKVYYHVFPPIKIDTIVKDPCQTDTAIFLKNGTRLVMDKCEFLDKKDCFEFSEIFSTDEAISNGLTTEDNKGNPMVSGGMINFNMDIKDGCKANCFDKAVRIQIPLPQDACNYFSSNPGLYNIEENGAWTRLGQELKIVEIGGMKFYEFVVFCPGKLNIDMPCYDNPLVKFKAPFGYDFIEITLISECPFSVLKLMKKDEKRDRIIKKRQIPCYFGEGMIEGTFLNSEGDTLVLTRRPIEELDKFIWFARCGSSTDEIERRVLGIFPYKKRQLYRKYVIKKEDLIPM